MTHIHEVHKFQDPVPQLLISILHEIGHKKTWDKISVYDSLEADKLDEKLLTEPYKTLLENEDKKTRYLHYNLETEMQATKWALRYYKRHKEEIDKLAKEINDTYK